MHERLGAPDARRFTQSPSLSWDYYIDEGVTIEYKGEAVFKIMSRVPDSIRDRTTRNPQVKYREHREPQ